MWNLGWLRMGAVVVVAICGCGGETGGTGGSGGSGGTGGKMASGGGGTAGSGGVAFVAAACGNSVACNEGARCSYFNIENATVCECDPSGHYMCNRTGMQTIPAQGCSEQIACLPEGQGPGNPCMQDNGYCVITCGCDAGCTYECNGTGPEMEPSGVVCDTPYCVNKGFGDGCWVKDGDCDYDVSCNADGAVFGECPPAP